MLVKWVTGQPHALIAVDWKGRKHIYWDGYEELCYNMTRSFQNLTICLLSNSSGVNQCRAEFISGSIVKFHFLSFVNTDLV